MELTCFSSPGERIVPASSLCVDACCAKSMFIEFEIFNSWIFALKGTQPSEEREHREDRDIIILHLCWLICCNSSMVQDLPCWCCVLQICCAFAMLRVGGRKWEVINSCKTEHFSFLFHFICLISLRKYFLCSKLNQLHKLSMNIIGFVRGAIH